MPNASSRITARFCLDDLPVNVSDIKSVKELLCTADPVLLADHILVGQSGWAVGISALGESARDMLISRVRGILKLISAIDASLPLSDAQILIPWQWFARTDERGCFRRMVGAAVVRLDKLSAAQQLIGSLGGYLPSVSAVKKAIDRTGGEGLADALALTGAAVDALSLSDEPWPDVLARTMWLPSSLAPSEKAMALSHVLWSMTYHGFGVEWQGCVPCADPLPASAAAVLDGAIERKMQLFEELLNYNSWVSSIEAARTLQRIRACTGDAL